MFSKMFGTEYIQGYTAALLEVRNVLDNIEQDLKAHKRKRDLKAAKQVIDFMIENRTILREDPHAFIRCNNDVQGGFEIYREGSPRHGRA